MSVPRIKSTYSLDVPTLKVLERVAKRWGVSKSEALRRAIHAAATLPSEPDHRLDALNELHSTTPLSPSNAEAWSSSVRAERRASHEPDRKAK
jgi:hypothetical protein